MNDSHENVSMQRNAANGRVEMSAESGATGALERLAMKAAADGCPREAVAGCTLTREYGKAECVACWKRWAGIDTANARMSDDAKRRSSPSDC